MLERILLLSIHLFLTCPILYSQSIIGKVVEKGSNSPLIGAHIYIINSLQGTVSNVNGEFTLTPTIAYGELLVTYVGYRDQKISFTPASQTLKINLSPASNELEEVSVKGEVDKKWKRLYKKFETSFLGSTENAKHCIISNPWVLDITKGANGEIMAKSNAPIEIINSALGYKLTYHLRDFSLKSERLYYHGDVYFDELKPENGTENGKWGKNRRKTFLGSKMHFITALSNQTLENEGFEVYSADFSPSLGFTTKNQQKEEQLLKNDNEVLIPDYLKIIYTKAKPQRSYISNTKTQLSIAFQDPKEDLVPKGALQMPSQNHNTQVSYLYSRNSKIEFTNNGYIINSKYVIEFGYWSWLGVAEMLPFDYELVK